ncbi:hypothetical protein [Photorhabdus heterorhabditis]|uniref:hypothetical protein n=1 Tax=Photorhabdus heterorhabditis TaxID=880156 RepID=UPI0013792546|nr:hypothetical protein [Photorhabdus heterorhabditis]
MRSITMFNNKAIVLSVLLSAANITGSSGLMTWVDAVLKDGGMIFNAYVPIYWDYLWDV